MRIPNDIDQILWEIAESNRTEDVLDFERRYPNYRLELHKRIKMVAALKQGKPGEQNVAPAKFTLRADSPRHRGLHPAIIAFATVLAVVAIGGVTQSVLSRKAEIQTRVEIPRQPYAGTIDPGTPSQTIPDGMPINPLVNPQGNDTTNVETEQPRLDAGGQPLDAGLMASPPPTENIPDFHKRKSLKIAKAPLMAALKLIADSGGLRCEFAPGFPNPDVVVDFQEMSPVEMIQQLGKDYAFSTFEEGERNLLFVPAVESPAPAKGGGGSGSVPSDQVTPPIDPSINIQESQSPPKGGDANPKKKSQNVKGRAGLPELPPVGNLMR
jgi:hypothetical protein